MRSLSLSSILDTDFVFPFTLGSCIREFYRSSDLPYRFQGSCICELYRTFLVSIRTFYREQEPVRSLRFVERSRYRRLIVSIATAQVGLTRPLFCSAPTAQTALCCYTAIVPSIPTVPRDIPYRGITDFCLCESRASIRVLRCFQ